MITTYSHEPQSIDQQWGRHLSLELQFQLEILKHNFVFTKKYCIFHPWVCWRHEQAIIEHTRTHQSYSESVLVTTPFVAIDWHSQLSRTRCPVTSRTAIVARCRRRQWRRRRRRRRKRWRQNGSSPRDVRRRVWRWRWWWRRRYGGGDDVACALTMIDDVTGGVRRLSSSVPCQQTQTKWRHYYCR